MANETVVEEPVVETPVTDTPAAETPEADETLLSTAGKETPTKTKVEETPEQKTAREATEAATKAEEDRLLKADDKTLKPEELAKKQEIVKRQEDAKLNSVPEDGKYEVKLPKELTDQGIELDAKTLEALSPTFKELGLTQGQVQKLAVAYAPLVKAQVEAQQQEAIALWNKQGDDWKQESVKLLGANAKTELAFAAKFMDRFGGKEIVGADGKKTNELRVLMEETKIGNNPVMLAAIIAAGKLLGEDKFVEGSGANTPGKEAPLYDHPTSKATLKY